MIVSAVVEAASSPEPVVDVLPARNLLSQPNYIQQQQQQLQQQQQQQQSKQQHSGYQQQQQQQQQHRQAVSSPVRPAVPNADSPYSGRQSATSTLVYSSQPNALGNPSILFFFLFLFLPLEGFLLILSSSGMISMTSGSILIGWGLIRLSDLVDLVKFVKLNSILITITVKLYQD